MKVLSVVLLGVLSLSATAADSDGYRDMLIAKARAAGMAQQFGTHCALDADLLRKHLAKYKTQTRAESLQRFPDLAIDGEYQTGADEGDRFYSKVTDAASRSMLCQQYQQQIQRDVASPL